MKHATKGRHGFSLVELLVVIAIVATLATAATTLHRKHAERLRLLDGKAKLLEVMGLQHRYYARELTYTDTSECSDLIAKIQTPSGYIINFPPPPAKTISPPVSGSSQHLRAKTTLR